MAKRFIAIVEVYTFVRHIGPIGYSYQLSLVKLYSLWK